MPRWRSAREELIRAGFSDVHHVLPLAKDDSAVIDMERKFGMPETLGASKSPRAQISIMLTHAHLWQNRSLAADREWLYVDEVDSVRMFEAE